MEYYPGIKRKKLIHAATWAILENMLSERSWTPKATCHESIYMECQKKNNNGSKQKLPMLLISQNENQQPGCMCLLSEPHNSTQRRCCQRFKPETNQDT